MDLFEAIRNRRSVRSYLDRPIDDALLEKLVDAAQWAPSGGNAQRWRFVVITSPAMVDLVRQVTPGILALPPAIIVVCSLRTGRADAHSRMAGYEYAIASQNVLLAAHGLGLGSCVIGSFSPTAIKELLSIPEGVEPELLITLGHPAKIPKAPKRPPVTEITFRDEYGKWWTR